MNAERGTLVIGVLLVAVGALGLNAQGTGTIVGVVTTKVPGLKPLRVTMDQRVCGNELPDEGVVVDGSGHLANAVVMLAGVKSTANAQASGIMNEKCRFAPRTISIVLNWCDELGAKVPRGPQN